MNYYAYEMAHAFMSPVRFGVQALRQTVGWPLNPMGYTTVGKNMVAACEVFENITRRYGKPEFGIKSVRDRRRRGCRCAKRSSHRRRSATSFISSATSRETGKRYDPKVLIVAPMSGHYATLLRGTVKAMLPEHDVYITDWADARNMPLAHGPLRPRRLHRPRHRLHPLHRPEHARHRRVPAGRAGARRRGATWRTQRRSCQPASCR